MKGKNRKIGVGTCWYSPAQNSISLEFNIIKERRKDVGKKSANIRRKKV
jgi:hypothetical protein